MPIADQLMEKLLVVLQQKNDTATQEAMMAMGAVADKCGEHFARYLPHVLPFVHQGLQNWEAYQACGQTAGVVGDICRACPVAIADPQHCDVLMQLLLADLENPQLNRQVKPGVISVIGDIAMAVEGNFDRWFVVGDYTAATSCCFVLLRIAPSVSRSCLDALNALRDINFRRLHRLLLSPNMEKKKKKAILISSRLYYKK